MSPDTPQGASWFDLSPLVISGIDATSLAIGIIGVLVSAAGFLVSIYQIRKTKRAAEAAKDAADQARANVAQVIQIVSLEQMCGAAENLLHLIRSKNWPSSAHAAYQLRTSLAKFPHFATARESLDGSPSLDVMVRTLHEQLERAASINKISRQENDECLQLVGRASELLSKLSGDSIGTKEIKNANS